MTTISSSLLATKIKEQQIKLTRSERRLADYLTKHLLDAAFLPAARLGEVVDVSESSVLRFAKTLGYANYQALQYEVQGEIRRQLTLDIPGRLQRAVARADRELLKPLAALDTDIHNLEITRQQIDPRALQAFITHLTQARNVMVVGMRGAAAQAQQFGYSLNILRPGVITLTGEADKLVDFLVDIGPEDALVGFAFSRQSRHTIAAVDLARRAGAPVLAVTDDPLSPIAVRANHALIVAMNSEAFIQSYTAVTSLTHVLLTAIGRQLHPAAMKRLEAIEQAVVESQAFFTEPAK